MKHVIEIVYLSFWLPSLSSDTSCQWNTRGSPSVPEALCSLQVFRVSDEEATPVSLWRTSRLLQGPTLCDTEVWNTGGGVGGAPRLAGTTLGRQGPRPGTRETTRPAYRQPASTSGCTSPLRPLCSSVKPFSRQHALGKKVVTKVLMQVA